MQMAPSHWWSLHVFLTFNWFNYMENEMVAWCAIVFFFFSLTLSLPSALLSLLSFFFRVLFFLPQRDEHSLMPRRQGNEISALPLSLPLPVSFSISASQKPAVWLIEPSWGAVLLLSPKKTKKKKQQHFVLVSEAPTLLCGLRALQKKGKKKEI